MAAEKVLEASTELPETGQRKLKKEEHLDRVFQG